MIVFISHISEEAPLALVLKEWIENSFLGKLTSLSVAMMMTLLPVTNGFER